MLSLRTFVLSAIVLSLSGCLIVNRDHLTQLEEGPADGGADTDSGTPGEIDAGGPEDLLRTVDVCGDSSEDYEVLADSTDGAVTVDTRGASNTVSSCGSRQAAGNDGFIAIDVQGGEQWHFHIIPDPSVPDQDRDPVLYLLFAPAGSCDARACDNISDQCTGGGDEHFAFVADAPGRWYLGIDDRNPGGGVYRLTAVRLRCGDNVPVHGEACDGEEDCSSDCHAILNETRPTEQLPNDNEIEANLIQLPTSNSLTVSGAIGGDACTYPDVYIVDVPEDGMTLETTVRKSDGAACDNSTLTPFSIVLRDSAGDVRDPGSTNGTTGCSELNVAGLNAGRYLVYLEHPSPIEDRPVTYRLRVRLTGP